ncbi:hypothetical protein GMRT_12783 [Giardia muris]|uniref:Uncharacterized protein n=1 Tax=Giardia muris TaxID=5742 RepID=A0A4Z1T282_GIAMU|nr:hypothetical protein GMRT_12783 [Giardia muris]|eukprot:TNJ27137.1 hypothetical protein GMRT_12783 [Giardia muris]
MDVAALDVVHQLLIKGFDGLWTLVIVEYDGMVCSVDVSINSVESKPAIGGFHPLYNANGGVAAIAGGAHGGIQYLVLWTFERVLCVLSRTKDSAPSTRMVSIGPIHDISALHFDSQTGLCHAGTHEGQVLVIDCAVGDVQSVPGLPGLPICQILVKDGATYTINTGGALRKDGETLQKDLVNAFASSDKYLVYGAFHLHFCCKGAHGTLLLESSITTIIHLDLNTCPEETQKHLSYTFSEHRDLYHRHHEFFVLGLGNGQLWLVQLCETTNAKNLCLAKYPLLPERSERPIKQLIQAGDVLLVLQGVCDIGLVSIGSPPAAPPTFQIASSYSQESVSST